MRFGLPDDFDADVCPPVVSRDAVLRQAEHDVVLGPFALPVVEPRPVLPGTTWAHEAADVQRPYLDDVAFLAAQFRRAVQLQTHTVGRFVAGEKERLRQAQEQEERRRLEKQRQEEQRQREHQQKVREEQQRLKQQQEDEQRRKREEEALQKEQARVAEEKKKQAELDRQAQEKKRLDADVALKAERQFGEYKQAIADIKQNVVDVVNANKDLKKQIGVVRRKINPKFGQLSNSAAQLQRLSSEMIELIASVQQYELPFKFLLNFVAKAIVSQAETEVVVQANAAVPLARLTSLLLDRFPDLNYYLTARFVKKCPLIIGYTCDIGSEEGRTRMGWRRNKESGKWEEEDKYDERVAGICSVWAVLTRLDNSLFPISMSWTFLSRVANTPLPLVHNVHFFCLANWWEACGRHFVGVYKVQAFKLLHLIAFELTTKVDKKYPAATRLKLLGEEGISTSMKSLKDMEP